MRYFDLVLMFLVVVIINLSCEVKTEEELYSHAMSLDNVEDRVNELKNLLEKYPGSKRESQVFNRLFRDYLILEDEDNTLLYASKYINTVQPNNRMSRYNSIAWTLAENDIGIDSAKVYADKAVELAKGGTKRNLHNVMDTQAFVYFKSGEPQKALDIQLIAMEGNENNYDFLSRLAMYQHAAGEKENAYLTMSRSVLLGGGPESGKYLEKWLEQDFEEDNNRKEFAKKISDNVLNEYLDDPSEKLKRSRSAVLLALLRVELTKAKNWATEAVNSLDKKSEFDQYLEYNMNLATVYDVTNNNSEALNTLVKIKEYASIYDVSYWLKLGQAYLKNNQVEEAIESLINGMLWRESPEFISILNELGLNDSQIKIKIKNKKEELFNFHPTKFNDHDLFSGKTVLVELFTGSECPPCKGADIALDLIAEYYPRTMVNILEYHLHIPGPDPLTNPDSEGRYAYYEKGFGTPTVFFNGQNKTVGGGSELVKKHLFTKYDKIIRSNISDKPIAEIKVDANLSNDILLIDTKVKFISNVKTNLNLNIAIVEKSVDYEGGNGIKKHAFVVRYLMTGAEGEKINLKQNLFTYTDEIGINIIENRQKKYLEDFQNNPPERHKNFSGWKEKKIKLNQNQLAVIAFIQNPITKQVLQSRFFDLSETN